MVPQGSMPLLSVCLLLLSAWVFILGLQNGCCASGCHIHVPSRKKVEEQKARVTASVL